MNFRDVDKFELFWRFVNNFKNLLWIAESSESPMDYNSRQMEQKECRMRDIMYSTSCIDEQRTILHAATALQVFLS